MDINSGKLRPLENEDELKLNEMLVSQADAQRLEKMSTTQRIKWGRSKRVQEARARKRQLRTAARPQKLTLQEKRRDARLRRESSS